MRLVISYFVASAMFLGGLWIWLHSRHVGSAFDRAGMWIMVAGGIWLAVDIALPLYAVLTSDRKKRRTGR